MNSAITIDSMAQRWTSLERPLFKGSLIDSDGCKCAQGDVLFCAGYSDDQLRRMDQHMADKETARILGISRTHAVLLRVVNDKVGGAPQLVLTNPEQVIGDKAHYLLAFWFYLDALSEAALSAARSAALSAARSAALSAARSAARSAALSAALSAARSAARSAALSAAWSAAWLGARSAAWLGARSAARSAAESAARSAAWSAAESAARSAGLASNEIQGMDLLEAEGKKPYFLSFFGLDTWDKVRALVNTGEQNEAI